MDKGNIKIALISFQKSSEMEPPVGLIYLATYLKEKKGIKNIKIFDKNFDNFEEIYEFSPDIIGIGTMTIQYSDAIDFAKNYKKTKDIPIVIGGVHISTLPSSFESCFDVGVIGEGEETFSEIVELYLKKGKLNPEDLKKVKSIVFINKGNEKEITIKRGPIELDSLPFPDFNFVNKKYFDKHERADFIIKRAFVITSRGCPYKCKFCSTTQFWQKVRLHSPEYVAKLIKHFVDNYGSDYIQIMDDLFTISTERLKQIKFEMERLDILGKIKGMDCQSRANLMNDDLCKILKQLKVKILSFGFESGSERILSWLKGGSVTTEMNKNAVKLCNKYGFDIYGCLMYGSPGEKIQDMEETNKFIDFLIKNNASNVWSFISTPFPNTVFWDIALERGKVSNHMEWRILNHHGMEDPLLLDEDISKQEFKKVFLKGRKKLQKIKSKLVFNFIKNNPLKSAKLFLSAPVYYSSRVFTKLYKQ